MDLDARVTALRAAVLDKDGAAVAAHLEAIDGMLEGQNPLLRATTYAHVKLALGRPLEAAEVMEDLLAIMGDDAKARYQIGCYRREGGDATGAREAFTRAAELDPMMVDAWVNLGVLLDTAGEAHRAVAAYRRGMLANPADVGVWRNLGNSLAALGEFDQAIDAYDTGLTLAPEDLALVVLRASSLQAQGHIERANDSVPEALRPEIGLVVEVRDEGPVDLRCRFHVPHGQRDAAVTRAQALLPTARAHVSPAAVTRAGDGYLVQQAGTYLLCDPDRARENLPNRFFDATTLVGG